MNGRAWQERHAQMLQLLQVNSGVLQGHWFMWDPIGFRGFCFAALRALARLGPYSALNTRKPPELPRDATKSVQQRPFAEVHCGEREVDAKQASTKKTPGNNPSASDHSEPGKLVTTPVFGPQVM